MLFTNNPDLRDLIVQNEKLFESTYELKVFGRFDDSKLEKIRRGHYIKGVKMGPFFVSLKVRSQAQASPEHSDSHKV